MKTRMIVLAIILGVILSILVPFAIPPVVLAQTCLSPAGAPIPCPEEEKKKRKTPTPPRPTRTPTPTTTLTPSMTPVASFTPTAVLPLPIIPGGDGPPPQDSGFPGNLGPLFGMFALGSLVIFLVGLFVGGGVWLNRRGAFNVRIRKEVDLTSMAREQKQWGKDWGDDEAGPPTHPGDKAAKNDPGDDDDKMSGGELAAAHEDFHFVHHFDKSSALAPANPGPQQGFDTDMQAGEDDGTALNSDDATPSDGGTTLNNEDGGSSMNNNE